MIASVTEHKNGQLCNKGGFIGGKDYRALEYTHDDTLRRAVLGLSLCVV